METPITTYEALRRHGVSRRDFLNFCAMTAAAIGLPFAAAGQVVEAMETKPRIPVMWLHGLECTCCSESFIRSSHPIAQDLIFNMISLDYDDVLQAAAGHQVEQIRKKLIEEHSGEYLLAVEGNAPTNDGGVYCTVGGETFLDTLLESAKHAKAIIAWGSCASNGCVQAAYPNPTGAKPVYKLVTDKPVINVPGCPPIAEVMTGVLTYMLTFDRIPDLDRRRRPTMFYGQRVHDRCYRRAYFDAGQFVESWDDEGARKGWCLYKMGCRGPTTYNACASTKWNECQSFPIGSGHGCFGCSEDNFWDNGPIYERLSGVLSPTSDLTADRIGKTLGAVVGGGIAVHAAAAAVKTHLTQIRPAPDDTNPPTGSAG
ncbi:MAG: hydrogenase small subunit [Bryobacterales bacterium]